MAGRAVGRDARGLRGGAGAGRDASAYALGGGDAGITQTKVPWGIHSDSD
jgi:hypothetical protein